MRRKAFTRISAVLTAAALFGSVLTGCGGNDSTQESASADGAAAEESVSSNLNATGLPILNEKETFTIAVPQQSTLKSAAEKQCVIDAEEATNVHIEWIEIPQSGWKEKINIMFSTDGLPDAIIGEVDMARYYEQLVALDDYLAEYAPVTSAYFETREDYPEGLLSVDGKLHCLPTGDEALQNVIDSQYWINTEWLDKLGLKMPTTTEEFKEVLIAFRDQDPNGNGQKDEIPFTFENAWGWGNALENMFGYFGVIENGYHVFTKDGKVTFSPAQQGYYDALAWFHELYAEGLIDKEAFTLSADLYSARGAGGDIIGVFAGYNPSSACGADNGDGSRYQAIPVLKGPNGDPMVGLNNMTRSGGFAISRNCKNPAALVRWYDYINSSLELASSWGKGPEGVWYEIVEENGEKVPKFLNVTPEVLEANGGYQTKQEFRTAESFAGQTPALWKQEYSEATIYEEGYPHDYKLEAVQNQQDYGVIGLPVGTATLENSDRRAILSADIDTYLQKFIADSVINGIDDEKWNKHLETLKSLKTDEYTALCQEFVDSLK